MIAIFAPGLFIGHKIYSQLGVSSMAAKYGIDLYLQQRPRGLNSVKRAELLKQTFEKFKSKVWLIGHSAGGIDIRVMLSLWPDLEEKVAGVITMGTPHWGSPIADKWLAGADKEALIKCLFDSIEGAREIVGELTTAEMKKFNERRPLSASLEKMFWSMPFKIDKRWKVNYASKAGYDYHLDLGFPYNDSTIPFDHQILGQVMRPMIGEHKAATLPIRYGMIGQTIWKKTYDACFTHIARNSKN